MYSDGRIGYTGDKKSLVGKVNQIIFPGLLPSIGFVLVACLVKFEYGLDNCFRIKFGIIASGIFWLEVLG